MLKLARPKFRTVLTGPLCPKMQAASGGMTRRQFAMTLTGGAFCPGIAMAGRVVDLEWQDLLPDENATGLLPGTLQGLINHDNPAADQPRSSGVRTDWNGETVRLSGFVLPLAYTGTGVTEFILVPYVGACIHVPPPPANQLVMVTTQKPYENDNLYDPVTVTGMLGTVSITTDLAEIGYSMTADRIDPFDP